MTYISGKITGDINYKAKFDAAERQIKEGGQDVINPAKICLISENLPYSACMDICLVLLRECDTVYMLNDWQESHGALIEYYTALAYGKNIIFEETT